MPPLYPLNLSLAADIEPAAKDTHSPPPQAAGQPERFSRSVRLEEEAGCFGLLTNVPTAGALAHSARAILTVSKDQHGTEQNDGFRKAPVIVHSLFLKKPERIEALGRVL